MPRYFRLVLFSSLLFCALSSASSIQLTTPENDPLVDFAVQKLRKTLSDRKLPAPLSVIEIRVSPSQQKQSYSIRRVNSAIVIEGGDSRGMMYGLLALNEQILFGTNLLTIDLKERPYLKKRGLKFNVPLDARNPSYDDTGDAAQKNIATVWDMRFWQAYLDRMAEYRYNQLTLWNPQPFTSMLKLEKYPGLAFDDVYISNEPLNSKVGVWGEAGGVSKRVLSKLKKVKSISIDEKIHFWQQVFRYAKDRGIDVHLITWSIYTNGINGAYGINDRIDNPKTQAFFREAVKEMVVTYPDLKGMGITAGERMPADGEVPDWTREKWLWQTYGLGLADAKKLQPTREIDFMHRFWYSGYQDIQKFWSAYPDHFSFSFKYLMARLYSSHQPSHIAEKVLPMLKENPQIKTWWNLRNDDIFVYRWGNPEYASTFYKNLPMEVTEGTHMGSDGYVWAKSFADKQIDNSNLLEIDKHWYRFMLWGRLAYNPNLDRTFFIQKLAQRFPNSDPNLLYDSWKAASEIVPAVNRYQFQPGDRKFSPETSSSRETFRYVNDFQVARSMPKSGVINARQYVKALVQKQHLDNKISPLQLADFMQQQADVALSGANNLSKPDTQPELARTLDDIRAFSYLGLYYADKIRAAVALEKFEKMGQKPESGKHAMKAINRAYVHWQNYRKVSERRYHSQMLARVNRLDWTALEKEVAYEKVIVAQKLANPFTIPETHDPDNQLRFSYAPRLSGESRHKRMEVDTPNANNFMVEVYEEDGVLINNYGASGNGPMRWEWFQERSKGRYYLNLKWQNLNRVIKVDL